MIVNAEVKFPVIQQTPNFILGSIKDPSQLLTVGEQNLKKGCFKNCRIVDSCGNEFRVISARKSKTEKLFRLWNLFPSYRLIKVDIELSESIKLDFDIFNAILKEAKIKVNRGIVVDEYLRTSINNVYAIGDCAEISGNTLPFIAPATFAAKALAKTLLVEPTILNIPNLAVAVKIPTCPTVVCPSLDLAGNWVVEGDAPDFIARFMNAEKTVTGFALTGKAISQKMSLLKDCVAPQLT